MESEFLCPFCGSTSLYIETPYIDPFTMEKKKTICCTSQAKNQKFIDKRYSSVYGTEDKPTLEEVSKE